jgi:hypothetical protein
MMFANVPAYFDVIIPFRPVDEYRSANLQRALKFWRSFSEVQEILLIDGVRQLHDPFNRARSFNQGVKMAVNRDNGLVLADVDVIPPRASVRTAMGLCSRDVLQPFDRVSMLDEDGSVSYITDANWSMVHVLTRKTFNAVGGHDERFEGWGFEDNAFAARVANSGREIRRLGGTAVHHWHPQNWTMNSPEYDRNRDIWEREYLKKTDHG